MGKINLLSFEVANLIAAGEVVDRPASVIKELLENAIDAGADRITVEIQHGGVSFMRVADNGCGMDKEDLPVAIRRHATSKIKNADDLDGISTLGFRGEALAAIAAVCDLRIITRTKDKEYGHVLTAHAGEVIDIVEQGAPIGTTVIVENLFANVPARRKFLKKDVSEAIAVSTYVEKIALSHPEIAFRLIIDGNMKLDTAGDGELKSAMYAVFGREFVSRMLPVQSEGEGIAVRGFVGRSDNVRPKRNYENFFINGRFVNCRTAAAALEQAYVSYIPPEKFPCCVLNITINPAAVDVNVHPAKLEVKFSNERPVFEAIYYAVRTALEENCSRPEVTLKSAVPSAANAFVPIEEGKRESLAARQLTISPVAPRAESAFSTMSAKEFTRKFIKTDFDKEVERNIAAAPTAYRPLGEEKEKKPAATSFPVPFSDKAKLFINNVTAPKAEPLPVAKTASVDKTACELPAPDVAKTEESPALPWRIVGEAFRTFVIVEQGEKLLLIDKHAAHERVLFEDLKARMLQGDPATQLLMLPITLDMPLHDQQTLEAFREEIAAVGFAFVIGTTGVEITEIPDGLESAAATELLQTLITRLQEGTGTAKLSRDILFEKALYQGACKAAIKAGREYPPEHIEWLCRRLMELPDITVCPHGRPVAMELTLAQLHRQFGRT